MSAKPVIRVSAGDAAGATARLMPPLRARAATPAYEGAAMQRRLRAWQATSDHVNALLRASGPTLIARSRFVARNNPLAFAARESWVAMTVGTGIVPRSKIADKAQKKALQEIWLDWTDEADADGATDYYGLQAMAAGAMFEAGECFIRFRPRRLEDGLSVPLQLQLLEAEQLPLDKNETLSNGNVVRCGIEFNRIGRRVAYHFYRDHPGDATLPGNSRGQFTRVPASDVLHLFDPLRPGQIRGQPRLAAALVRLFLLDQYEDAELERMKTSALFSAFIKVQGPTDTPSPLSDAKVTDAIADVTMEPGGMTRLFPGEEMEFSDPPDVGSNYDTFLYRGQLNATAAMGVLYASATGDYRRVNYSSQRAAVLDIKRRVERWVWGTIVFQMCRPVWRRFVPDAVLAGAVALPGFARAPAPFLKAQHILPRWEWVDPLKDGLAERLQVRAGFKSRTQVVAERGDDIEETDAQIAQDNARADEHGLILDSDARRVTSAGVGQFVDPDPADVGPGQPAPEPDDDEQKPGRPNDRSAA